MRHPPGLSLLTPVLLGIAAAFSPGCDKPASPAGGGKEPYTLRIGHFPNVTHAQAVVAHALSRQGKGWFEERLGPEIRVEWYVYNAGPSAMEAIFAQALDITYVGPSPAINAYSRSNGEEVRVLAGAANGGSALVIQGDGRIKTAADFRGKKVATPQLGNTQDVACRAWLMAQGFHVTQLGGDVTVLPTPNPDQLALFQKGEIDAVWTVEPWVSRLELEANGKVFLEEKDAVTTLLASRRGWLKERPDVVEKVLNAHEELTAWIQAHPAEAQALVRTELKAETTRDLPETVLARSWARLQFTRELQLEPLEKFVRMAQEVGFLKELANLSRFLEPPR